MPQTSHTMNTEQSNAAKKDRQRQSSLSRQGVTAATAVAPLSPSADGKNPRRSKEADESLETMLERSLQQMEASDLMKGIVYSEILGKPLARRRRSW